MKLYLFIFVLFNLCFINCRNKCKDGSYKRNLDREILPTNTPKSYRYFFERTGDTMIYNTNGVVIEVDSVIDIYTESCLKYDLFETCEQVLRSKNDSIFLSWMYEQENSSSSLNFNFKVVGKGNNGSFYFSESQNKKVHLASFTLANKNYKDVYLYTNYISDTLVYSQSLGIIYVKPAKKIYSLVRLD